MVKVTDSAKLIYQQEPREDKDINASLAQIKKELESVQKSLEELNEHTERAEEAARLLQQVNGEQQQTVLVNSMNKIVAKINPLVELATRLERAANYIYIPDNAAIN